MRQDLMSDGSEFQVCGAATENARHADSVRVKWKVCVLCVRVCVCV